MTAPMASCTFADLGSFGSRERESPLFAELAALGEPAVNGVVRDACPRRKLDRLELKDQRVGCTSAEPVDQGA